MNRLLTEINDKISWVAKCNPIFSNIPSGKLDHNIIDADGVDGDDNDDDNDGGGGGDDIELDFSSSSF